MDENPEFFEPVLIASISHGTPAHDASGRQSVANRIQFERVLEGIDRLRKLLELRISRAEEVPGVGIAVVNSDNVFEVFDRRVGIAAVFVQHA